MGKQIVSRPKRPAQPDWKSIIGVEDQTHHINEMGVEFCLDLFAVLQGPSAADSVRRMFTERFMLITCALEEMAPDYAKVSIAASDSELSRMLWIQLTRIRDTIKYCEEYQHYAHAISDWQCATEEGPAGAASRRRMFGFLAVPPRATVSYSLSLTCGRKLMQRLAYDLNPCPEGAATVVSERCRT